jgi:hypothetical protein
MTFNDSFTIFSIAASVDINKIMVVFYQKKKIKIKKYCMQILVP